MSKKIKEIIIIGGGGLALEIFSYIIDDKKFKIKGVLNEDEKCELLDHHPDLFYLGTINDYVPTSDDEGLICVGKATIRKKIYSVCKEKNLKLVSYFHSSSHISSNSIIGDGVFIGPHCIISAHSNIKDNVALNVYCGVGHGATIDEHSVMSPYSVINGDCKLGEGVFLGSRVTLFPKIEIGSFSMVDAGAVIRENIPSYSIVSQRVEQKTIDNRILRKQLLDND